MDQEHETNLSPEENAWLDEILPPEDLGEELGPHESVEDAGLVSPDAPEDGWDPEAKSRMTGEPFQDEEFRDTFGEGDELNAAFADENAPEEAPEAPAEEPEAPEEAPEEPVKKGRPRRKKGYGLLGIPHILATFVWLAIAIAIGVSLGRVIWVCVSDVMAFGRSDTELEFQVTDSDTVESVAQKLKDSGLIRYPGLFKMYADLTHAENKIAPGIYKLKTNYDYHALVNGLTPDSEDSAIVTVVVPEGYTCREIFALLEEKGVCTAAELEDYAANGELEDYWFLDGLERGDKYCLEGYLFPDTYDFYIGDEPGRVITKFLDDFDYRFTDKMKDNLTKLQETMAARLAENGYSEEYIAAHPFTLREVMIVASMVQQEAYSITDSYLVSSVIYNRLADPDEYPFLNIDATLLYVLQGERTELTAEDLQMDSPYNTYNHAGLTPGPICNPGRNSIYAALEPQDTNYHYYALEKGTDEHHFSETLSEHEAFLASQENG